MCSGDTYQFKGQRDMDTKQFDLAQEGKTNILVGMKVPTGLIQSLDESLFVKKSNLKLHNNEDKNLFLEGSIPFDFYEFLMSD